MTIQVHHIGNLKDVEQLQLTCAECHTRICYDPTRLHGRVADECPNCHTRWLTDGRPSRREALDRLAWLLKEIAESELPFAIHLDFGASTGDRPK